jgi:XTP/dITP diphosphohydrolase
VGFDWEKREDVWDKVQEEISELQKAENEGNQKELEEEMGDLIFSIVNYARFIGINPENALRRTNEKFVKRFRYIEEKIGQSNKSIADSNLEEMDKFWEESKKLL